MRGKGRWFRREQSSPDVLVEDLLDHALKIARYGIYTGRLKLSKLFLALAAVIELAPEKRRLSEQKVLDLKDEVEHIVRSNPLRDTSFSAMSPRWSPRSSVRQSWPFVLLAIVLLYWASVYTSIYSNGEQLVQELDDLQQRDVVEQFGQLELKILLSNHSIQKGQNMALSSNDGDVQSANLNIARSLVYDDIYLISKFDKEIAMMQSRFAKVQDDASNPFPYFRQLRTSFFFSLRLLVANQFCSENWERLGICLSRREREFPDNFFGLLRALSVMAQPSGFYMPQVGQAASLPAQQPITLEQLCVRAVTRPLLPLAISDIFAGWRSQYGEQMFEQKIRAHFEGDHYANVRASDIIRQNCGLQLKYYSATMPNLRGMRNDIETAIRPYATIYIPALFGAIGSLMYYMRTVLNPMRINPTFREVAFRVALGGLAGVLIVWIWQGFWRGQENGGLAYGVFILAFVAGFSERVFFDLLDRLVKIGSEAVRSIGTKSKEDTVEKANISSVDGTSIPSASKAPVIDQASLPWNRPAVS